MSGRAKRAITVMATSAVLIALAAVLYLRPQASGPTPGVATGVAAPGNPDCSPGDLVVKGRFWGCVKFEQAQYCPATFDLAKVIDLSGPGIDLLLYVQIGAYHGPGSYRLKPWPDSALGVDDGVAKVALRDYWTGELFKSTGGTLTVSSSQTSGTVSAALTADAGGAPVADALDVSGRWSC